jgi:hypothetical protein
LNDDDDLAVVRFCSVFVFRVIGRNGDPDSCTNPGSDNGTLSAAEFFPYHSANCATNTARDIGNRLPLQPASYRLKHRSGSLRRRGR